MSDKPAADVPSTPDVIRESTADDGRRDVRIAAALVAEAGQMLDALTHLPAQPSVKLSAAEKLLAELDDARTDQDSAPAPGEP